jgi:hypothetical protein
MKWSGEERCELEWKGEPGDGEELEELGAPVKDNDI